MSADKMQTISIGICQQLVKTDISELVLPSSVSHFASLISDLSVLADGQLSVASHMASVWRSAFIQLHQLSRVHGSLKTLVPSFFSSCLNRSATDSSLVSRMVGLSNLSRCRMPLLDWPQALRNSNTLRQCGATSTGYRFGG
jgi:hypothetical protein